MYNDMIQYLHILQNGHHKSGYHSSPYIVARFFSLDENF